MVEYKIVKFCRLCRKKYNVTKGEQRKVYCPECQVKVDKEDSDL